MFHFRLNAKIQTMLEKIYDLATEEETLQPLITKFLESSDMDKEKAIAEMHKHLNNSSKPLTLLFLTAQYFSLTLAMERFGYPILKEIKFLTAILTLRGYDIFDPQIKALVLSVVSGNEDPKSLSKFLEKES